MLGVGLGALAGGMVQRRKSPTPAAGPTSGHLLSEAASSPVGMWLRPQKTQKKSRQHSRSEPCNTDSHTISALREQPVVVQLRKARLQSIDWVQNSGIHTMRSHTDAKELRSLALEHARMSTNVLRVAKAMS